MSALLYPVMHFVRAAMNVHFFRISIKVFVILLRLCEYMLLLYMCSNMIYFSESKTMATRKCTSLISEFFKLTNEVVN